jgi:putative tryptophan/tyrosine transport system substrate-binding protein
MKRRAFITFLVGGSATWPLRPRAQQGALPVIGFLASESPVPWAGRLREFQEGLGQLGLTEGRNVAIEYRWADGRNDRLPALAADLVRRGVSLIAANGPAAVAAQAATMTVPIVFFSGGDPVARGLVASLTRPGGNLTGVSTLYTEVGAKRLEVLHELVPAASTIALLVNPTNTTLAHTLTGNVRPPVPLDGGSKSFMPAQNANSMRRSRPWSNFDWARLRSATMHSSTATANNSPH